MRRGGAWARLVDGDDVVREIRAFETTAAGLSALSDWLGERGCTRVAMAATGVDRKPARPTLSEGRFALLLAKAAHVKDVPGRKADVSDAPWLAALSAHGLIRGSFAPAPAGEQPRAPLRTRQQPGREEASRTQRLRKTPADADTELDAVVSTGLGVGGRALIEAPVAGGADPAVLAGHGQPRLKVAEPTPRQAC